MTTPQDDQTQKPVKDAACDWTLTRFDGRPTDAVLEGIVEVARACEDADGHEPFNEQSQIQVRRGEHVWGVVVTVDASITPNDAGVTAAAVVTEFENDSPTIEMAVHPNNRGHGMGTDLSAMVASQLDGQQVNAWAHGDHDAAGTLARRVGLARSRALWSMRLTDPQNLPPTPDVYGVRIRPFVVGQDEDAWLAVNAASFASHPEQGKITREDLDERISEDWFDPNGFLLAESIKTGEILGFHWTKVHPAHTDDRGQEHSPMGEVYVVGVSPSAQSGGLGTVLTLAGVHHLVDQGHRTIMLYVDADNTPAVALYDRLGFERWDVDVMYSGAISAPRH